MRSAVKQLKRRLKPLKCDPQSNLCSCNLGLVWVLLMWLWCDSHLGAELLYKWLCLSVCLNTVSFSSFPVGLNSSPSPSFNYPLLHPFPCLFSPSPIIATPPLRPPTPSFVVMICKDSNIFWNCLYSKDFFFAPLNDDRSCWVTNKVLLNELFTARVTFVQRRVLPWGSWREFAMCTLFIS